MDLAEFLSLLEDQTLYFSCIAKFADPYEGLFPLQMWRVFAELREDIDRSQAIDFIVPRLREVERSTRHRHYVNCWHMNTYESAAMWEIYQRSGEGIAIQSTYARLRDSLEAAPESLSFGKVQYIDFHASEIKTNALPWVLKRKSFEHENELRAIYTDLSDYPDIASMPSGHKIGPVDLDKLIEKVYIAPTAEPWIRDLVETILHIRYGLDKPVVRSDLLSGPVM